MEDIVLVLFALIPYFSSESPPFTASACYGSGTCNFVYLECNKTFIHILSVQYIFTEDSKCSYPQLCNRTNGLGCCEPTYVFKRGIDLSEEDKRSLNKTCSSKRRCQNPVPWTMDQGIESSVVQVKFTCKRRNNTYEPEDKTNLDLQTESLHDSDNTAAIVVPVVVVLLAIVLAALVFLYWKRKKQRQTDKPANTGNGGLQEAVQNDAYFKSNTINESVTEEPQNTYHTIDLNSLPGNTDDHQAPGDPGPQDDYNMIDPNKMDYEMPSNHDYFVLEPRATEAHGENFMDAGAEYNKINLESNDVVKDPNYHRLGSLGNDSVDKQRDVDDSYSHLEIIQTTVGDKVKQEDILNDDYSHLK